ncbi:hypothetical protein [Enterococcus sp. 2201sp1_2201st1_B8_2201SCRN_220225]|uniref:hypothetical protein n=1 Tax=unclassified Enterococcus TaxID=2608891 RepID=UPI0034A368AC
MRITIIRNTGFFGMGSPLTLKVNHQKSLLSNQKQAVFELPNQPVEIQVSFFLLKSQPYQIQANQDQTLEVTMNPAFVLIYLLLFGLLFILSQGLGAFLAGLVLYFLIMYRLCSRAYLIKEVP